MFLNIVKHEHLNTLESVDSRWDIWRIGDQQKHRTQRASKHLRLFADFRRDSRWIGDLQMLQNLVQNEHLDTLESVDFRWDSGRIGYQQMFRNIAQHEHLITLESVDFRWDSWRIVYQIFRNIVKN